MATLQDFYPWVSIECPSVPNPIMDDAIRKGAREFCKQSHAIEADVAITTVDTQPDYAPTMPTHSEIVEVISVKESPDTYLDGYSQGYIESQPTASGTSDKYCLVELDPLKLRLYPTPDTDGRALTAKFVIMPTVSATTVDSKLLSWYQEGVTNYACYYLMSQLGTPWSNPETAAFKYRQFETRVGDAKIRRSRDRAGIPQYVTMQPFA